MHPSLRRSCRACTKAKRRCEPNLPACSRCATKAIECIYDLEPVVHSQVARTPASTIISGGSSGSNSNTSTPLAADGSHLRIIYDSVATAREASIAAVANGDGSRSAAARPMLMADPALTHWFLTFFTQVAHDALEEKSSPFVHVRIFTRKVDVRRDIASAHQAAARAILDHLCEIHDLITQTLKRILVDKANSKRDTELEELVVRMFTSTREMWSAALGDLNVLFEEWEAWAVAESVRRSMFAAVQIRGMWHALAKGYLYYEPFFESLPFDARAGVWEAETQKEWLEVLKRYGDKRTELKSYHEFITKGQGELHSSEDGRFQRLLFACYHGSYGVAKLEALSSTRVY